MSFESLQKGLGLLEIMLINMPNFLSISYNSQQDENFLGCNK